MHHVPGSYACGTRELPAAQVDEQRALDQIDADGTVRLACQLRPNGDISAQPLLAVAQPWWRAPPPSRPTVEHDVALLFCRFTVRGPLADAAVSAHDAIYALDRFHRLVSDAWLEKLDPQIVVVSEGPSRHLHYYTGYATMTQNMAGDITMHCVGNKVHFMGSSRNRVGDLTG